MRIAAANGNLDNMLNAPYDFQPMSPVKRKSQPKILNPEALKTMNGWNRSLIYDYNTDHVSTDKRQSVFRQSASNQMIASNQMSMNIFGGQTSIETFDSSF
jgi:hypothetical protein